jgi:trans-L-3-hydroxyproline dehydratase
VLFLHNEGFSTMCGHGIIGITTVVLETGLFPKTEPVTELKIDSPAGLIHARALIEDQRVQSVSFRNVPSFVLELDRKVTVPGWGEISVDLAFGGAFYAYTSSAALGLSLTGTEYRRLIEAGMAIKRAVMASGPISHPFESDLSFLYGTILIGPPVHPNSHSRNVCIFAEGEVDRSPTGTGVSGRLAIHHARGEIQPNQSIIIESILGSRFIGTVAEETRFGPYPAVIPEVSGTAFITGMHRFLIDPDDPWKSGFFLR